MVLLGRCMVVVVVFVVLINIFFGMLRLSNVIIFGISFLVSVMLMDRLFVW